MTGGELGSNLLQSFNKTQLSKLKKKAIRSGVWFKALQRIDRALFDLTIIVVENIHSAKLTKSILMLTKKLEYFMKSNFSRRIAAIGSSIAQKISLVAQKLGNAYAYKWASDSSFAFFLAAMQINNDGAFKR
jgi:hypothetical protein